MATTRGRGDKRLSEKFQTLQTEIKKRSHNQHFFHEARKEWQYVSTRSSPGGECLCTYKPITDHNEIQNKITGLRVEVGNVCIRHFVEDVSRDVKARRSLRDLRKDGPRDGRANIYLLRWMKETKPEVLDKDQFKAYIATKTRGRILNEDQQRKLLETNLRILQGTDDERPNCQCNLNPSLPARLHEDVHEAATNGTCAFLYECGKGDDVPASDKCQLSVRKKFKVS